MTTETELREPVHADAIPHDLLWSTLRRLQLAAMHTLQVADRELADVPRTINGLRDATQAATDLFYPPPEPEKPEDAEPMYARGVRERDQVWFKGSGWLHVEAWELCALGVRWRLRDPAAPNIPIQREFEADDVFTVRRHKKPVQEDM